MVSVLCTFALLVICLFSTSAADRKQGIESHSLLIDPPLKNARRLDNVTSPQQQELHETLVQGAVPPSQTRLEPPIAPEAKTVPQHLFAAAAQKAFKGGIAGFAAGVLQVLAFMWLRTIMNRQYYKGGRLVDTGRELWQEGGIPRFYQGLPWAIIDAPLARFGDTFANAGVLALLSNFSVNTLLSTMVVSTVAALWRIAITPIDTLKTTSQVQGAGAVKLLLEKVSSAGVQVLWAGALGNFAANWAGNYPWWAMFNTLSQMWAEPASPRAQIIRNGVIGICSSVTSDCVSNSFRVLKTMRQAHPDPNLTYTAALKQVSKTEGITSILTRGLGTRVLTNVIQGTFFSIVFKLFQKQLAA